MSDLEDKIKNLLSVVLKIPKQKIKKNFSSASTKKWDSLNHVKIITALESRFKLKIKPDFALELLSYKKIFDYIKKNI